MRRHADAGAASDRSDLKPPWLTASGQTTILLHSGGEGGIQSKSEEQSRAKQIAHAPEPAMRRPDEKRDAVPVTRDDERPLPDARGSITRRTGR